MQQNSLNTNEVAIVIPIYREAMSRSEQLCFRRNIEVFAGESIVLVAPFGLNVQNYTQNTNCKVEFFDHKYFQGITGYNRFMLSKDLYERFNSYKYILICQLDVFVFSDQLNNWCNKNYDYIGAPWINKPFKIITYIAVKVGITKAIKLLFTRNVFRAVGNGGFSLRKVESFINSLNDNAKAAAEWPANEDYYWSFFATNNGKAFITPTAIESTQFCIELDAEKIMKANNNALPFAIHAWERYNANIWKPYLNKLGYEF